VRFGEVLGQADVLTLRAEVAALRLPERRLARGVSTRHGQGERARQFQAVIDERRQSWTFDRQGDSHRDRFADGVLHSPDGPVEVDFARSGAVAPPVRLLTPELLLLWGPPASYAPVSVQRDGEHQLLLTFEHERDRAQQVTLVVDERDGIARRFSDQDETTVITEVRVMGDGEPEPGRPRFSRS
jgi:hypothetical protein